MDYLDYAGIAYQNDGPRWARLESHDSLVIDRQNNKFTWNSRGVSGRLHSFIKNYDDVSWEDARLKMLDFLNASKGVDRKHNYVQVNKPKSFNLSNYKIDQSSQEVRDYLVDTRKLDAGLVDSFVQHGYVAEDKDRQNALFIWRDKEGKQVGADLQGTKIDFKKFEKRGTFKSIAPGSLSSYGFNFTNGSGREKLYITESPIDLLSYYQLDAKNLSKQNASFLSLSGAASKAKTIDKFMKERLGVVDNVHDQKLVVQIGPEYGANNKAGFNVDMYDEVHFAVDNDAGGRELINKFKDASLVGNGKSVKFFVDLPADSSIKDWNEALKKNERGKIEVPMEQFRRVLNEDVSLKQVMDQTKKSRVNQDMSPQATQVHEQSAVSGVDQKPGLIGRSSKRVIAR